MTQVKICGITNVDDALAAIEAGAELLGFNFYPKSPRYVSSSDARKIIERLPKSVLSVGVFVNDDVARVVALTAITRVGAVQLHGEETPEFCKNLNRFYRRLRRFSSIKAGGDFVIKAMRVGKDFRVEDAAKFETDAVLLDAFVEDCQGGTGHTFDWSIARRTREVVRRLVLAGGLTPENIAAAVKTVRPYAVDVCSGVETAPGRKSIQLMRRFVEAVRACDGEDGI